VHNVLLALFLGLVWVGLIGVNVGDTCSGDDQILEALLKSNPQNVFILAKLQVGDLLLVLIFYVRSLLLRQREILPYLHHILRGEGKEPVLTDLAAFRLTGTSKFKKSFVSAEVPYFPRHISTCRHQVLA